MTDDRRDFLKIAGFLKENGMNEETRKRFYKFANNASCMNALYFFQKNGLITDILNANYETTEYEIRSLISSYFSL